MTQIEIGGVICNYKGGLDSNGKPSGLGEAKRRFRKDKKIKYNGTWRNGSIHGLCKFTDSNNLIRLGIVENQERTYVS